MVAKELMKAKREGDALSFNIHLECMKRRQQIFDGNHSLPEIVALDTIASSNAHLLGMERICRNG
jgi:hypothetical protein